jgi:hypothetical protein
VRAGRVTTAFLTENPPLSEPPRPHRPRSGAHRGGSTSPLRRPGRRPTSTPRGGRARGAQEQSAVIAPMPGTVIRVLVEPGTEVARATAARRARGDEDGDAARRAVRRDRAAVHVGEGDRVAAEPCWWSWTSDGRRRLDDAADFSRGGPLLLATRRDTTSSSASPATIRDSPDRYPCGVSGLSVRKARWPRRAADAAVQPRARAAPVDTGARGACRAVAGEEIPGVTGTEPEVHEFAELWSEHSGVAGRVNMRQGVYALEQVASAPGGTGIGSRCDGRRLRARASLVDRVRRGGAARGRPGPRRR